MIETVTLYCHPIISLHQDSFANMIRLYGVPIAPHGFHSLSYSPREHQHSSTAHHHVFFVQNFTILEERQAIFLMFFYLLI